MFSILINGALGKMGRMLAACAMEQGVTVAAGIDTYAAGAKLSYPLYETLSACQQKADVLIDFSRPDAFPELIAFATARKLPLILATTGYTADMEALIDDAARVIPIFRSANMSVGVNVLLTLARAAARDLPDADIEIVETHHNTKADAPSGTALLLADGVCDAQETQHPYVYGRSGLSRRVKGDIGIHAIRGGTVAGTHEVHFFCSDEELTLTHAAASRRIFALGALKAAAFLLTCKPGRYQMRDMLLQHAGVTRIEVLPGQTLLTLPAPVSGEVAALLTALADRDINVDMLSGATPGGAFSCTIFDRDVPFATEALSGVTLQRNLVKLTVIGLGMENQRGIAAGVFRQIDLSGARPYLITTSETQISLLLSPDDVDKARRSLSLLYNLPLADA